MASNKKCFVIHRYRQMLFLDLFIVLFHTNTYWYLFVFTHTAHIGIYMNDSINPGNDYFVYFLALGVVIKTKLN